MSVFTTVDTVQLDEFLERYLLGRCRGLRPIAAGVTNTNYYLETDAGSFVLTLYEHHSDDELDYILGLQQHLAARSVHCSFPVVDRRGELYSNLNRRPAAIIHQLAGDVVDTPSREHCQVIATELARFHLAGQNFDAIRPNPRGLDWLVAARDMLDSELSADDDRLIDACLQDFRGADLHDLPHGAIHADLFHDNALFDGERLGGIIDFDYACSDLFVFDIAVLLNDWCVDGIGELDPELVAAVIEAYQRERSLERRELEALPLLLRIAALRFWLSRLYDKTFPLSGELTYLKSPEDFRRQLELRSESADALSDLVLPHRIG